MTPSAFPTKKLKRLATDQQYQILIGIEPPLLNGSIVIFRKRRITNGKQAAQESKFFRKLLESKQHQKNAYWKNLHENWKPLHLSENKETYTQSF